MRPESFAAVEQDLRDSLERALTLLNMNEIAQIIDRISAQNPGLAGQLRQLAKSLAYGDILHAMERFKSLPA
jgi:hypothetical protein